jgi:hypothetical protein
MKQITIPELHEQFRAQGASAREHIAFKCPVCETVQSMASLKRAGCPDDKLEKQIGFSCEGRWSKAGPWPSTPTKQKRRRLEGRLDGPRGCDWTLGGLFRIHTLEVINEKGDPQPIFELASPEETKALEALMVTEAAS